MTCKHENTYTKITEVYGMMLQDFILEWCKDCGAIRFGYRRFMTDNPIDFKEWLIPGKENESGTL